MVQKVMLEVNSEKPLSQCGDGHIIVYDETKGKYYATTRESFLSEQNAKIQMLEQSFEDFTNEFQEKMEKYIADTDKKISDFLATYKETNGKMIEMVKSIMEV